MRLLYLPFFFASVALAQGYFETSCQYKGKDAQCDGGAFCAMGEGKNISEAKKDALKNIAGQVSSSISIVDSSIYKQMEAVSNRGKQASESEETVRKEVVKSVLENVSLKTLGQATVKNKVNVAAYVCKSDVAKSYSKQQSLIADSLKITCQIVLGEHPKGKNEAWRKTQTLWSRFLEIQNQFDSWGIERTALFNSTSEIYAKARDSYVDYCRAAVHWKADKENSYSEMFFSKLSAGVKMETSPCKGKGISIVYNGATEKCAGSSLEIECSLNPSLVVQSCGGEKYSMLKVKDPITGSSPYNKNTARENMIENLSKAVFFGEWEKEIMELAPRCE